MIFAQHYFLLVALLHASPDKSFLPVGGLFLILSWEENVFLPDILSFLQGFQD